MAALNINAWGALFLFVIAIALPFLAIRTHRVLGGRPLPLPRAIFYWQTIFLQMFLYALALIAAATGSIALNLVPSKPERAWIALVLLVVALATLRLHWPFRSQESKARLVDLLPHDRRELVPYLLLCVVAAIAEEIAYRGVAYRLVWRFGFGMVATIAIVSFAFALGHMVQGWKSAAAIFVYAVAFHAVVIYTNALLPAIVVHFVYDAVAGLFVPRWK